MIHSIIVPFLIPLFIPLPVASTAKVPVSHPYQTTHDTFTFVPMKPFTMTTASQDQQQADDSTTSLLMSIYKSQQSSKSKSNSHTSTRKDAYHHDDDDDDDDDDDASSRRNDIRMNMDTNTNTRTDHPTVSSERLTSYEYNHSYNTNTNPPVPVVPVTMTMTNKRDSDTASLTSTEDASSSSTSTSTTSSSSNGHTLDDPNTVLLSFQQQSSSPSLAPAPAPVLSSTLVPTLVPTLAVPQTITREPLRFHFKGYSVWLELQEIPINMADIRKSSTGTSSTSASDLTHVIQLAAQEQTVESIPSPHVTLFYGMDHFDNDCHALTRFNRDLRAFVTNGRGWPSTLKPIGMLNDVSYDGVDGEEMDMAWQEITFATSNEHERMLDEIHQIMYKTTRSKDTKWKPHLSLAYDNPEETTLCLSNAISLISRYPSLMKERKVNGISLWRTNGMMKDWKCLDRIVL